MIIIAQSPETVKQVMPAFCFKTHLGAKKPMLCTLVAQ